MFPDATVQNVSMYHSSWTYGLWTENVLMGTKISNISMDDVT